MTALIAALILGQGSAAAAPKGPVVGPTLPSGCNEAVLAASLKVQERLEAGDFEGAKALFRLLPKNVIRLGWDATSIPANLRVSYAAARDRVIKTWEQNFSGSKIEVVDYKKGMRPPPMVAITFVPSIPPREGEALPVGAAEFFSESPDEPRLEYVIGLQRGNPAAPTDFVDVHNEIAHALTRYYGVERTVVVGSYSARTDLPASKLANPSPYDRLQVQAILDACSLLAKHLMKQEKIVAARPKIHFDPAKFDLGEATQGDIVKFKLQITNLGNAPLVIRAMPDCSCMAAARVAPIEPGESRLVPAQVDLHDVAGSFDKHIVLYSNDIDKTVTFLPVHIQSNPLYRLISENDGNVLMQDGGVKTKVFLVLPEASPLKPIGARFDGVDAKVSFQPWSGKLADPSKGEPERERKGYVFDLEISDQIAPGRSTGTLWVKTDHPLFKEIYVNLFIQRGIVALPDQIRMGEIPNAPRRAAFLVSRPGRPFKITSLAADTPFLKISHAPSENGWEYRVNVQYDGRAALGMLRAVVSVHTDDPKQPVIQVPFEAIVQ